MKRKCTLFIIFLSSILLHYSCDKTDISDIQSESFVKFFGGSGSDKASGLLQMPDGGYAIIGSIETSDNGYDIYLIRTDKFGNQLWEPKIWGDSLDDTGYDIEMDNDGNLLLLGSVTNPTQSGSTEKDALLIKVNNEDGQTLWTRKIGSTFDEEAYDLLITESGDYLLGGYSSDGNDKYTWMVKIQGEYVRTKRLGFESLNEEIISITELNDGNGYLTIGNRISGSESDILPRIFGPDLSYYSGDAYQRTGKDEVGNLINDNNNFITLSSSKNITSNKSIILLSTLSIDDDFPIISTMKEIESPESELYGKYIYAISSGGYAIIGSIITAGNEDIYLLITDSQGNTVTSNTFGGTGTQVGIKIEQTADGGFIILGTNTFDRNSMITLIKTKPDGSL
ncbi:MAG: hypothetical protein JXB49_29195 [Bacteroidales bacterium]|nr:hypothetical protein [Bacteroidales bacterium]